VWSLSRGIPTELITPLVMVSRSPGVLAQWRESVGKFTAHTLYFCRRRGLTDFNIGRAPAIWRPQQIYTGSETGSTSGNDHYIRTKAPRSPDNKEKAPSSKLWSDWDKNFWLYVDAVCSKFYPYIYGKFTTSDLLWEGSHGCLERPSMV
jgi:hypothetical protein